MIINHLLAGVVLNVDECKFQVRIPLLFQLIRMYHCRFLAVLVPSRVKGSFTPDAIGALRYAVKTTQHVARCRTATRLV